MSEYERSETTMAMVPKGESWKYQKRCETQKTQHAVTTGFAKYPSALNTHHKSRRLLVLAGHMRYLTMGLDSGLNGDKVC
jgi:hypothetical protein